MRRHQAEVDAITASLAGGVVDPSTMPFASPWSSSDLQRIVAEDVFGSDLPVNTRSAAMRLGPVVRGRNLLCTSIARNPLVQKRVDTIVRAPWLTRASGGSSPQARIVWTVDDLIFYGWSCWTRENGADGFPVNAGRVNFGDWIVNADNKVEINGVPQPDNRVILIPGWFEGILTCGIDAIRDARTIKDLVRDRLENPVPWTELHQTGGKALVKEEREELVQSWRTARKAKGGAGVGFTNEFIELKTHGEQSDNALMIEGNNAAAVELARHVGVSASMVDATAPKASLNYETSAGRNQEFVDLDLGLYMDPITARLSLDDVCPQGQHIAFDLAPTTDLDPSPTGPALED